MSETNKSTFKQTLLIVLMLLLFIFASLQAWYIFEIKKQLSALHKQQSSVQLQLQTQNTVTNEKDIAEKNPTEASPTEKPADVPPPSLQQTQQTQPAQQDKSLSTDNKQSLSNDKPATTTGGQAWGPNREIERMQRDMDRMFNRRFNNLDNHPDFNKPDFNRPDFQYRFSQSFSTPEMNVKEDTNQYTVLVKLPGADKSDISVTLNGQRLTVQGKQDYKKQNSSATGNVIFQESRSGRFQRSITLASPVNKSQMKTHLNKGVLTIIIPKVKNGQWRYQR